MQPVYGSVRRVCQADFCTLSCITTTLTWQRQRNNWTGCRKPDLPFCMGERAIKMVMFFPWIFDPFIRGTIGGTQN